MSAGARVARVARYPSPAVARLDDGSYRIRQAGHVIALEAAQAVELVGELQKLLYPPRKARDWDCV